MALTKMALIAKLASSTGVTEAVAGKLLNTLIETIIDETSTGNSVTITGFGTFKLGKRSAREGVVAFGPSKGQPYSVPERNTLTFKAGASAKNAIN